MVGRRVGYAGWTDRLSGSRRLSLPTDFELKERVRAALDIVDVVGRDLELRPQGRHFVARCPFHHDTRPSMTVNPERQIWKCWVCDIGGDIFSFVMRREGVEFPTALKILADQAGIPYEPDAGRRKAEPGSPDDKAALLRAVKLVADEYFRILESGDDAESAVARDYLRSRGIDDDSRRRFRIGFAPGGWSFAVDLLRRHQIRGEVGEAAGLILPRSGGSGFYDRFRGRLMFPIHDLQDRPVSLGGRLIPELAAREGRDDPGAKYINGPETLLFRKSHQLYGLQLARDVIRRTGEAFVMEGYTDVVAARQAGIEPVVAVLGTALGDRHIRILKRFAQRVVLVLDGDEAGRRRADEVTELFVREDVDLRVLTLPDGMDPADFIRERGPQAFRDLAERAPDALDHRISGLTAGVDVTRDTHKAATALETLLAIVAKAPAGGGLRVDQLLLRLSRTFGISTERLEQRLDALRRRDRQRSSGQRHSLVRRVERGHAPMADPNLMLAESAEQDAEGVLTVSPPGARPRRGSATNRSRGRGEAVEAAPPLTALSGMDRELFETLIECPELAAMAVEAVDPQWLQSDAAKMLLSAYQDLDLQGRPLDLDSLLLMIENEQLKGHVVDLHERVLRRGDASGEPPEARYAATMTRYREREFVEEKNRHIARLESRTLEADEEVALLQELIQAERTRMGITAPPPPEGSHGAL